ncbi:PEP-CTERM sorting domain-containing protein [Pacificimonas flava]|nr:PEP-CTERM sorting domain-containing protein [Pacificimonas flava]MBB5279202.1 hypothetical protein [Pacificimonas flava]
MIETSFRKALMIAAGLAALAASGAQASAVKVGSNVDIVLAGNGGNCSGNACNWTAGYTAFDNSQKTVNVRATAWSISNGGWNNGTHSRANIDQWAYGLGVQNAGEPGYSPHHTMDNGGYKDYVALEFDSLVNVNSVKLALYQYSSYQAADGDVSILIGNVPTGLGNYINPLAALGTLSTGLSYQTDYWASNAPNVGAGNFAGFLTQDDFTFGDNEYGNVVVVAADLFESGGLVDAFKLKTINIDVFQAPPPSDVPAPGALALLGLGLAGLGLRQRKRAAA